MANHGIVGFGLAVSLISGILLVAPKLSDYILLILKTNLETLQTIYFIEFLIGIVIIIVGIKSRK